MLYFQTPSTLNRKIIKLLQIILTAFYPNKIQNGKFKGLKITKNIFGSSMLPKLVGTYEEEISNLFHRIVTDRKTNYFVDIGCAGGFYCEIATQLKPDMKIVGYDINERAIKHCRKIISNATFFTEPFNYEKYLENDHHIFFLFDIEGGEFDIFHHDVRLNRNHEFLIEVHAFDENLNKDLDFINQSEFEVTKILFEKKKTPIGNYIGSKFFEFIARHELRNCKTYYLHIKAR